ncbi:uncharacterized protein LOC112575646 [Pomacea canaliculata]|uniref:uncharacterized protein LOC112575646 n=1 Tax=Pomacea canaliculata TaxID=400727 RepID=UPI000D729F3F|nr:uncharacterized protein LOC112575646 [Pomacea canaliculata]
MNNFSAVPAAPGLIPWDNPHDILTRTQYLVAVYILNCVIKPVVVVIGLPSNIINCVVFWRQGLGDRMNVCLLALSVADLGLITMCAIFGMTYYIERVDPVTWDGLYAFFQAYLTGVGQGFRTASGCITTVIAVERCLCVVFPLKAASLIRTRTMAVMMVFILCFSQAALFTMPARFVVLRVNNTSAKFGLVSSELFMNNQVFFTVLENIVMMNVIPIATFVVVAVCTALTVVKLRAAMTWRKTTSCSSEGGQGQHTALTKMLVLVCCVYILTTIPWVIFYLANVTVHEFSLVGQYYNLYMTSIVTVYYFPYINSSLSFFVFFGRSTRFQKHVLRLCCDLSKFQSAKGRTTAAVG